MQPSRSFARDDDTDGSRARDLTRPLASTGATGAPILVLPGARRAFRLRGCTQPEPSRPARLLRCPTTSMRRACRRARPWTGVVSTSRGARSETRRRSLFAAQRPRDVRGAGRRYGPPWRACSADRDRHRGDRCLVAPRGSGAGPALRLLRIPGLPVEVRLPGSRLRPAAAGRRGLRGGRGPRTRCSRISRPSKRLPRRSTSSITTARHRSETRCAGPHSSRAARRRREASRVLPSSGSSRRAAETWAQGAQRRGRRP